jgi:hydroxymethylpyrimidine pyrophosphatase-like HAD family hydrolase
VEPLQRIQLVLSDLDESLLSPSHQVGARSRAAIAGLQAAGITFAVCTGRAPEATRAIVRDLGIRYFICNNGASVHDGDQILAQRVMDPTLTASLTQFFDAQAIPVYLMTPEGYFLTQRTASTDHADQVRGVAPTLLPANGCHVSAHKVMAWGGAPAFEACRTQFGGMVHIIYHADYLEIAPKGVSKQWGGERLAEHLGMTSVQVAAVGDGLNDLEMVRWAGVGAAMGNADAELKEIADLVLPGHFDDGTATLFEAILVARA